MATGTGVSGRTSEFAPDHPSPPGFSPNCADRVCRGSHRGPGPAITEGRQAGVGALHRESSAWRRRPRACPAIRRLRPRRPCDPPRRGAVQLSPRTAALKLSPGCPPVCGRSQAPHIPCPAKCSCSSETGSPRPRGRRSIQYRQIAEAWCLAVTRSHPISQALQATHVQSREAVKTP